MKATKGKRNFRDEAIEAITVLTVVINVANRAGDKRLMGEAVSSLMQVVDAYRAGQPIRKSK